MAIKSGYFKKRLHVDLTRGKCERTPLSAEFVETYIGGRGFGAKLVWDNLVEHQFSVDPLGPENLLVIAPGPLTGTYVPSSGKCSWVSISPATGIYGDSNMGGTFGVELRQTGVDAAAVARGALGNPWFFRQVADLAAGREPHQPTLAEQREMMLEHLAGSCKLYGPLRGVRHMRKFGIKYARLHPHPKAVRMAFVEVKRPEQWHEVLDRFYT